MIKKIVMIATCVMLMFSFTAYASETQSEGDITIPVRIKADVPEDFNTSISLQYTGKETAGFSIALSKAEDYTALINLQPDIYTYKESKIAEGFKIDIPKTFYIEGTDKNAYLLPITINAGDKASDIEYVNVLASAEFIDVECQETIQINYSGTNGNAITFELSEGNEYTTELSIPKDLYTLKNVKFMENPDLYTYDTLYAINTEGLNENSHYAFKINVMPYTEEMRQQEETKKNESKIVYGDIVLRADIPESANFDGSIFVTYKGEKVPKFEVELNAENHYFANLEIPAGKYNFMYAVSYDSDKYTYSAQPSFSLDENGFLEIPVYLLQDGVIVREEPVAVSENEAPIQEVEDTKNITVWNVLQIAILLLCGAALFILKWEKLVPSSEQDVEDEEKEDENEIDFEKDNEEFGTVRDETNQEK